MKEDCHLIDPLKAFMEEREESIPSRKRTHAVGALKSLSRRLLREQKIPHPRMMERVEAPQANHQTLEMIIAPTALNRTMMPKLALMKIMVTSCLRLMAQSKQLG